jgi:uncharacterized Zn finger protein
MPFWDYYEPTRPREAKGGIKAQSKRGTFGETWWAKRWMMVLESFDLGARLTRGRSYARSGQVLSIDIEPGMIQAKVQGSRPKPYTVKLKVKTLSEGEWRKVAEALSEQALFAAKLLAGEMPNEIEDVFRQAGLSLFPASERDLETDCSCPDWSNPCKHIAAVYCLLGEEFDRDPFLLFRMRGITREAFTDLLSGLTDTSDESAAEQAAALPPEPLTTDTTLFWTGQPLPEDFFGEVSAPPVTAALPRRLGNFPFWRGEAPLLEALTPFYTRAAQAGMDVFLCERN